MCAGLRGGGGYGGCSPGDHSLGGPEIQGPHYLQCMSNNNLTFQFIVLINQNLKEVTNGLAFLEPLGPIDHNFARNRVRKVSLRLQL
jgi:hypothetical protein